MLNDAYKNRYDLAVLISNDSDLSEALRIVRDELGKQIGILNPHKNRSYELSKYALFCKQIRPGSLPKCQFPDQIHDGAGKIIKPDTW